MSSIPRHTLDKDFLETEAPTAGACIIANKKAVWYHKKSSKTPLLSKAVHQFRETRFNSILMTLKSTFGQYVDASVLTGSGL